MKAKLVLEYRLSCFLPLFRLMLLRVSIRQSIERFPNKQLMILLNLDEL